MDSEECLDTLVKIQNFDLNRGDDRPPTSKNSPSAATPNSFPVGIALLILAAGLILGFFAGKF